MKRSKIPFYKNKESDTHCLQAAMKIVLGYYFPNKTYSFKELDKITGHREGQWTYPYKMYTWLTKQGVGVEHVERFPMRRFTKEGVGFLKTYWDPDYFDLQKKYSDFDSAQKDALAALKDPYIKFRYRHGTVQLLREYWSKRYMLIVKVNPYTLRGIEGLGSHVVVVTDVKKNRITIHDPGLPPKKSLTVDDEALADAMFGNKSLIIALYIDPCAKSTG